MISHFVGCIKFPLKYSLQLNLFRKITNYDFSKWCETHYDWLQCIQWLKLVQVAEGIFDQGHAEEKQPPSFVLLLRDIFDFAIKFVFHQNFHSAEILSSRDLVSSTLTASFNWSSLSRGDARPFYYTIYVVFSYQ